VVSPLSFNGVGADGVAQFDRHRTTDNQPKHQQHSRHSKPDQFFKHGSLKEFERSTQLFAESLMAKTS